MRETHKFELELGNCVTISEVDQGEYLDDKIMVMLEDTKGAAMALLLTRKEAWGVGRAMMGLGSYAPRTVEDE